MQLWSLLHAERTEMNEARDASRLGGSDDRGRANGIDALKVGAVVPVARQRNKVHHCVAANHRRVERRTIIDVADPGFQFSWGGGHAREQRCCTRIAAHECRHGVPGAQ